MAICPSLISVALAVVPPMSKAIRSARPRRRPISTAEMDPAGGAGLDDQPWPLHDRAGRRHAAAGLHHRHGREDALLAQARLDVVQVPPDDREYGAMHGGSAEAFVLTKLAADLVAHHDRQFT